MRRQHLHNRVSSRPAAQFSQGFQHRVISLLASVAFDTLPAGVAKDSVDRRLPLEFIHQSSLACTRLPGNENDLPLPGERPPKVLAHLAKRTLPPHKPLLSRRSWLVDLARGIFLDRSDKVIPSSRQRFNESGILRVVTKSAPNIEDVALEHVRLNMSLGPHRIQEFVLRHQPARMVHEISQNGVRLRL